LTTLEPQSAPAIPTAPPPKKKKKKKEARCWGIILENKWITLVGFFLLLYK